MAKIEVIIYKKLLMNTSLIFMNTAHYLHSTVAVMIRAYHMFHPELTTDVTEVFIQPHAVLVA